MTRENWKQVAVNAIDMELPKDINLSVGYGEETDDCLTIAVACEPGYDGDREMTMINLRLRWWNTRREELEEFSREFPGAGFEAQLALDDSKFERPSISIESHVGAEPIGSLVPGYASVAMLKQSVQEAVLDALYSGGGFSMVFKDRKGRFVRQVGSYILDRQRPKRQ